MYRERDDQPRGVAPPPARLGHEQAEQEAEERGEEDEPEVGGLVLPGKVEVGDAAERLRVAAIARREAKRSRASPP